MEQLQRMIELYSQLLAEKTHQVLVLQVEIERLQKGSLEDNK
jgi:hypothetical protein